MQCLPAHRKYLHLAGYALLPVLARVVEGGLAGRTLVECYDDNAINLKELPGDMPEPESVLELPVPFLGQVLIRKVKADEPGCEFTLGVLAEFGNGTADLRGFAVLVPIQPYSNAPTAAFAARMYRNTEAQAPFVDEMVQCFAAGMDAHPDKHKAWTSRCEYDRRDRPVVPTDMHPQLAMAQTIRPGDPHADSNGKANCHLDALVRGYPFEGGMAFDTTFAKLNLDFSDASLARLDMLLDQIRDKLKPQLGAFISQQAKLNFLHLMAIYIGRMLSYKAGARIDWYTYRQLQQVDAAKLRFEHDIPTSLLAVLHHRGPTTGYLFQPLRIVMNRLFAGPDTPTVQQSVEAALPFVRAARIREPYDISNISITQCVASIPPAERGYLDTPRPAWANESAIKHWFDDYPKLLRSGQVTWGRLIQGNNLLFQPGDQNHPGEIIYDTRGILGPSDLDEIAERIWGLKHIRQRDPALGFIADHLTNEYTNSNGFPVPLCISSDGARLTSLMFNRVHLPSGKLSGAHFPVLVDEAYPGAAMILPSRFWPQALIDQWMGQATARAA